MSNFYDHFRLTCCGRNLYRAYNSFTNEAASPVMVGKEAVVRYVELELKRQLDENIHELLGGDNAAVSVYDGSPLCGGLYSSVERDGTEEKRRV